VITSLLSYCESVKEWKINFFLSFDERKEWNKCNGYEELNWKICLFFWNFPRHIYSITKMEWSAPVSMKYSKGNFFSFHFCWLFFLSLFFIHSAFFGSYVFLSLQAHKAHRQRTNRRTKGVNFINILRTRFSYESAFLAPKFCTKALRSAKFRTKKARVKFVDEIDKRRHRLAFSGTSESIQ